MSYRSSSHDYALAPLVILGPGRDFRRARRSDAARDIDAARTRRGCSRRSRPTVRHLAAGGVAPPAGAPARSPDRTTRRRAMARVPAAARAAADRRELDRPLPTLLGRTAGRSGRASGTTATQEEKTMTARDTFDLTVSGTIRAPRQKVFEAFAAPRLSYRWRHRARCTRRSSRR